MQASRRPGLRMTHTGGGMMITTGTLMGPTHPILRTMRVTTPTGDTATKCQHTRDIIRRLATRIHHLHMVLHLRILHQAREFSKFTMRLQAVVTCKEALGC